MAFLGSLNWLVLLYFNFYFNFLKGLSYHHQFNIIYSTSQKRKKGLAGVAQLIEYGPAKHRVTGSIPSQGTCLGCRPDPQ